MAGNRHVWEVKDVPGIETEPGMPAWDSIAGRMGVKYFPQDPALRPRRYPIQFREATRQDDVFDIALPQGHVVDELPPPASAECEYASYKSEVKFSDGVLHYQRTYEIKDLVVPTLKLAQLKRFFEQVGADESSAVALRRANP